MVKADEHKAKEKTKKAQKFDPPGPLDGDGDRNAEYDYAAFDTVLPHDLPRLTRDPNLQTYVSTPSNLKLINEYLQVSHGDNLETGPRFKLQIANLHAAVGAAVSTSYLRDTPMSAGQPLQALSKELPRNIF